MHDPFEWSTAPALKDGDTVSMTSPTWTKRRWWQFWMPRWIEGPVENRHYVIRKHIPADAKRAPQPEGQGARMSASNDGVS